MASAPASDARRDQLVFIHVSDLHIGTSLLTSPETFHGGFKSGLNPHDHRLLRPFELAVKGARKQLGLAVDDPTPVVMSGDLTQAGLDNDYATSFALLHQRLQWRRGPQSRWIGLDWPVERVITIPGNHDHWRHSSFQTGFTHGLSPAYFEATPWQRILESPGRGIRVELYGVDSNSGLEDQSKKPGRRNLFAGGRISDVELSELEALLQDASETEEGQSLVRVLVCHHAFSNSGGLFAADPLSDESRRDLLSLAGRYGVSVALTGHTHSFHEQDWPVARGSTLAVKELRCGTTFQGTTDRPGLQGFWIHQITRDGSSSSCEWTAWKYQFGAKFFELDAEAPPKFAVPLIPMAPEN